VSWELALRHCAAIRASLTQQRVALELLESQVIGLEAYARQQHERESAPTARIELPDHCDGKTDDECALQNDEAWVKYGSLTSPKARFCKGCRALSSNGVTLDP
jgi:hypothetical protein